MTSMAFERHIQFETAQDCIEAQSIFNAHESLDDGVTVANVGQVIDLSTGEIKGDDVSLPMPERFNHLLEHISHIQYTIL